HIAVDDGSEIVRAIETTSGSVHDSVPMDRLLERAPARAVYADWKARRSLARCRYEGLKKNALHFTLLAIAHNLRRWSVLAA
ncbi:transposase, partial [Thiobacillus sp.]